jgi:hypothetical protein
MRQRINIILLVFITALLGCKKIDLEIDVSKPIEREIRHFLKEPEGCEGAAVWQYPLGNDFFYAFTPGRCCSDCQTKYYDSGGNLICKYGGIAPYTDCNKEILDALENEPRLVWKNE